MKNQCSSWEKSGLRANSTWCLSLSFPNTLKVLKHHRGHDQKPYNTFSKKPVAKMLTIITIFFSQSIAFEFYINLFKANFIKFSCPWVPIILGWDLCFVQVLAHCVLTKAPAWGTLCSDSYWIIFAAASWVTGRYFKVKMAAELHSPKIFPQVFNLGIIAFLCFPCCFLPLLLFLW